MNPLELQSRKVVEVKQRLIGACRTRILISNEVRNANFLIETVEKVDGSKPQILIRIKNIVLQKAKKH